jgi:hypothetical protein
MINKNIFGFHSSFYYFGLEHLCINMHKYVNQGIRKNQFICIFSGSRVYDCIRKYIDINEKNSINISELENLVGKSPKIKEMQEKLSHFEGKIIRNGYEGIRIILDVSQFIVRTSKDDFLKFDADINEIIRGSRSSVMCLYDFEDYVKDKKIINDEIIQESYKTHPYRLYRGEIVSSKKLLYV